jgi:hypothetical protein
MIILYLIFTQKKDYIDTHNPIGVGANKQKPLVAIRRVDVSPIGFEPMTASLEGRCSIQLSYEPILVYKMVSFAAANIQIILKKDCFLN